MSSASTSKPTSGSPKDASLGALGSPISFRNRRGSVISIGANSTVEKEQLANALDKIHNSASQSDCLTTFNDFAPPPANAPSSENRNSAGDLVQQGFSGLYSRFREAVGKGSSHKANDDNASEHSDPPSKRGSIASNHASKLSISSLKRVDTSATLSSVSSQHAEITSPGLTSGTADNRPQPPSSSKGTGFSLITGSKSNTSSRQSLSTKAASSIAANSTVASVPLLREENSGQSSGRKNSSKADLQAHLQTADSTGSMYDHKESRLPPWAKRDETSSVEGSVGSPKSPTKTSMPSMPSLQTRGLRSPSVGSSLLSPDSIRRRPRVIDRVSPSRPTMPGSRDSSVDRGTAEASAISTSAHNSVRHESFSEDPQPQRSRSGEYRIPGTATNNNDDASEQVAAQLDKMRRQVLSKEFWMKDDTVKECFLCQTPFSAFRRKHHCRTCGCIFDSKCTTVISGDRFGVQGSLRVCKRCLEVISRRFDGSGSEDSADEQSFMPRFFGGNSSKPLSKPNQSKPKDQDNAVASEGSEDSRPLNTPLMAIPAARRLGESTRTALEIGVPQLSRPGSSRSLKSLTGRPMSSASHRRLHSKHGFLGRFNPASEDRAPFRKGVEDDNAKQAKFPAFHDDNIIDPELADYMSDESSEDEQMSIFAAMSTSDLHSTSYGDDKSDFSPYVNSGRKHRHRADKSISGMSQINRGGFDDFPGPSSFRRPAVRRRNLSNVSGSVHHLASPRPKSGIFKGPSLSSEMLFNAENSSHSGTQLTRSDSLQHGKVPKAELNNSSQKHVHKLLHQLLEDASIPNPQAWNKALVPILLQATDDVDPDVAKGDDMDIRHYVKLKRIPGGKPGDTSYVSGVVFTKNLALKSMPRKIMHPRIVLVTFPIEYQRHQHHFMSLQPVIEQEKEYLRVVVQRITNLRPHVLLAEKSVSGVALQYLSEANISVAYNVKHTVIEAVSRCAETEIISSLDMLALPVQVGRCMAFEVRTFVNNDHPGRKKSYIFLSGCKADLGCTIALRGASSAVLAKVKHIMEFMVYVVYNLKLESSLLRDESIEPPADGESSMSSSMNALPDSVRSLSVFSARESIRDGPSVVINHPTDSEPPTQTTADDSSITGAKENRQTEQHIKEPVTQDAHVAKSHDDGQVPDDVPMPTFYSNMVAKYETKILSASPYVKFTQPYLLMNAREQERRLLYLKRLRDQDVNREDENEVPAPDRFQLITPEMVDNIGQKAPRQMMEILHAVHDAEYDKALYNYQTQTRQWEAYIQGNLDLFDPYSHQNIVVLYSVICTETKIPCTEPELLAINFYDEQHIDTGMDPDCTLGQYIEDLAYSMDHVCNSNGCEKNMAAHHRTYVHDESRVTVFVERVPNTTSRQNDTDETISMWIYCKNCKKDSREIVMSDATFKYSFGKYLELLFWSRGLRMNGSMDCPHDHHRDHVRYFSLGDARIRIHLDPIDLLEIVVPRARITWKVGHDLRLKNEVYTRLEERWGKFMASVKSRLKSIRIDSVLPEKAESCKTEVDRLLSKVKEDQPMMVRRLQEIYVNSRYYEVVPFNSIVREMLEEAGEWDLAFAKFEADFLGDKDMRQLTMMQLKKMFTDNESKESLASNEGTASTMDTEMSASQTFMEADEKSTQPTDYTENSMEASTESTRAEEEKKPDGDEEKIPVPAETIENVKPLDLATPSPILVRNPMMPLCVEAAEAFTEPAVEGNSPNSPNRPQTPDGNKPVDSSELVIHGQDASTSDRFLTEKVEQIRREQAAKSNAQPTGSNEDPNRTPERPPARKSGSMTSPPLVRASSQPARMLRTQPGAGKGFGMREAKTNPIEGPIPESQADGTMKIDKKLTDRLGLNSLKTSGRGKAASSIPRFVHKKKEAKVSTLAKHFEQLSREFEKERIRDRNKRAASMRQPRAMLPRTSTKAIVEVYEDVHEAFDDPSPPSESQIGQYQRSGIVASKQSEVQLRHEETRTEPPTPLESDFHANEQRLRDEPHDDQQGKGEDEHTTTNTSQNYSDDEGGASDLEHSMPDEFLPDIKEIADSLEPSAEIPLELPKHQRTSLMKYLANFWAERSASGWMPLEYPVNPTDHIFVDSDIIVREDEPSSVIALALSSDDYASKLANIRSQEMMQRDAENGIDIDSKSRLGSINGDWAVDEAELEKSLLRVTGTHLKYQFREGSATMTCKIFYAEQFDALRRKCGVAERIVESLSRCMKWDSRGGKTKSVFLKTLDDRLVLKSLSPIETSAFLRFAPGYFNIMAEALFHDLPSVIAKMLGFFQVLIKNPTTGIDVKLDLLITENLFYDRSPSRIFDLKGSMRNRKIQSTGERNEVLLDENMVEYIYESPLFAREHSKKLLGASVYNDTLFLARQNVMDYSLMIAVDEPRKELVVGIIDCIRTYTWDKKLESWIKDRGFAGGGRNRPTVTSPKEYKSRFREAMARYILQAPNCWHLFYNPHYPHYGRARFEEPEGLN